MTKENTKASNSSLNDKQYKLSDFIPEFSGLRTSKDNSRFGCESIDNNLFRSYKKGMIYFKSINVCCPKCDSRRVTLNATKERELIFLNIGNQTCLIQQFKCKKCGTNIPTDLSSIVKSNANITYPVIDHVIHLYSFFHGSVRKIQKSLKKEHNIQISHQSIENIILFSDFNFENEDWSLSGYYIFDALWVKKNGKWFYLICLFDSKLNTIIGRSLLKSESSKAVEKMLKETLHNQKKICITTDLKKEYRIAIEEIDIKHQFCLFHTKQKINKDIKDDIKDNNRSEREINELIYYKSMIYEIINVDDIEIANKLTFELIRRNDILPEVISDTLWNFIIPYFENLTYHHYDDDIESTSNKLENCFHHNFGKSIKKLYKSENGILKRFDMRLLNWDDENKI